MLGLSNDLKFHKFQVEKSSDFIVCGKKVKHNI